MITILVTIASLSAYLRILVCDFDKTSRRVRVVKFRGGFDTATVAMQEASVPQAAQPWFPECG
jgi:hypothetical protein